jgi:sialic acid synthase SpsE
MTTEIIAEIGWNFMGDITLAERMVSAAASAGATSVKFQYWNPKKLKPGPWDTDGRKEIYESAALSEEKVAVLISLAQQYEVDFLCSAFNVDDALFLASLGVSSIKIPSHETYNMELHRCASSNFERCYVSLGAGTRVEVLDAIDIYNDAGGDWIAMHCVSSYPLDASRANLDRITWLGNYADVVGYSDHTESLFIPAAAVLKGARVVEKHFTADKTLPGRDNKFALEQSEFATMVEYVVEAEQCVIKRGFGYQSVEADTVANYRGRWG